MRYEVNIRGKPASIGVSKKTSYVLALVLIFVFSLLTESCAGGKKYSKDGYEWVPLTNIQALPSAQREVIAKEGRPNGIWKTPFGTTMWVYCFYEVPTRVIFFGEKEMIKEGEPSPNRKDLCEEP